MNYNFNKVIPPISSCHKTTMYGPKLTKDQNIANNQTGALTSKQQKTIHNMSKQSSQILDTYVKKCNDKCDLIPNCKSTVVLPNINTKYDTKQKLMVGEYEYDCYH